MTGIELKSVFIVVVPTWQWSAISFKGKRAVDVFRS